ncbi:MAG TPA: hypothetical protein VKZ41_07110 [Gemmatimonadales bacterium]|nr:hypothetical protein [Gemmatimonadales bacterium]
MQRLLFLLLSISLLSACQADNDAVPQTDSEEAFAELQARGQVAMGVDQYASRHLFDALPDGGRIELQQEAGDAEAVETIRKHLREIAVQFKSGDFRLPSFVHDHEVPGTKVMTEKQSLITYTYSDLPAGGQVRITTEDEEAIRAIHEFMEFQRQDHRAGGHEH